MASIFTFETYDINTSLIAFKAFENGKFIFDSRNTSTYQKSQYVGEKLRQAVIKELDYFFQDTKKKYTKAELSSIKQVSNTRQIPQNQPIQSSSPTTFSENIKLGSKGEQVKLIQAKLGVRVDGIFGQETLKAVKKFQTDNQLTPDGIVGERTFRRLFPQVSTVDTRPTLNISSIDPAAFNPRTLSGTFSGSNRIIGGTGTTQSSLRNTLDTVFRNQVEALKKKAFSFGLDITNYFLPDEEIAKNIFRDLNPSLSLEDLNIMVYGVGYNPNMDIAQNIQNVGQQLRNITDNVTQQLQTTANQLRSNLEQAANQVVTGVTNAVGQVQVTAQQGLRSDILASTQQFGTALLQNAQLSNSSKYSYEITETDTNYEAKIKYKRLDNVVIDIGTKKIPKDYKQVINGVQLSGKENLLKVLQHEAVTKGFFGFLKEEVRLSDNQIVSLPGNSQLNDSDDIISRQFIANSSNSPTSTSTPFQSLKVGSRGEQVKQIQTKLGLTPDGIFGPLTLAAVKKFQTQNQLTPDGIVDERTFRRIVPQAATVERPTLSSRLIDPAAFSPQTLSSQLPNTLNLRDQTNTDTRIRTDSFTTAFQAGASASIAQLNQRATTIADEATRQFEELKRFNRFSPYPLPKNNPIYKTVKDKKDELKKMINNFVAYQQEVFNALVSSLTQTSSAIPAISLLVSTPPFNIPAALSLGSLVMAAINELVGKVPPILNYITHLQNLSMFVSKKAYQELVRILNPMIQLLIRLMDPISLLKKFMQKILEALKKLFTSKNCDKQIKRINRDIRRKNKALKNEKDEQEIEDIKEEIKELEQRLDDTKIKCGKGLPIEQDVKDLNQVLAEANELSQNLISAVEDKYVYDVRLPDGSNIIGISEEELESLKSSYSVIFA